MGTLRVVLRLSGELDLFRVDEVNDEIRAAMLRDALSVIELDCSELASIGPEGIRMLLELGQQLRKPVVLTSMNDDCRHRIRMMGLEDMFGFQ